MRKDMGMFCRNLLTRKSSSIGHFDYPYLLNHIVYLVLSYPLVYMLYLLYHLIDRKNDFAEVSKNLAIYKYRSKNNFVEPLK